MINHVIISITIGYLMFIANELLPRYFLHCPRYICLMSPRIWIWRRRRFRHWW